MKTNWILFILVCLVAYGWLLSKKHGEEQEYREKMEEWEITHARWQAEREERDELYRQIRESARLSAEEAATTPSLARREAPTDAPPSEVAPREERPTASLSAEPTEYERILGMETARRHVVDTPLYRVEFTEWGARPISWEIKDSEFVRAINGVGDDARTTTTVQLIPQTGDPALREFPLELSGRTLNRFNHTMFEGSRRDLPEGVELTFQSKPLDGLQVVRTFFFRNDSYAADFNVTLINGPESHKPLGSTETGYGVGWQGGLGKPEVASRLTGRVQGVFSTEGHVRNRNVARDDAPLRVMGPIDWGGMENKYFTAIVIPAQANPSTMVEVYYSLRNNAEEYRLPGVNLPISVNLYHTAERLDAGDTRSLDYQIFVGPKNRQALRSPALVTAGMESPPSRLVFHTVPLGMGWLRPLCLVLLNLMRWLYEMIGQWGIAIIATTLVVRTIIYPLTHWAIKNQARTMIEQQKIRPEMEAINKKYKKDPTKRNQAIMQLYRDHNVNPLGFMRGCLPMLLQMPVFLALYVVFEQSVELRGQSFLWINDLSAPDALYTWGVEIPLLGPAFNLLPILMAATNFALMKIMQTPSTDELQARIQKQMMIMMPIFLLIFLYRLPSGLILYWTISNCVSMGQSYFTKKIIAKHMAEHEEQKKLTEGQTEGPEKKKLEQEPART